VFAFALNSEEEEEDEEEEAPATNFSSFSRNQFLRSPFNFLLTSRHAHNVSSRKNWKTNYRLTYVIPPLLFFFPRLTLPPPGKETPVSDLLPAAAAVAAAEAAESSAVSSSISGSVSLALACLCCSSCSCCCSCHSRIQRDSRLPPSPYQPAGASSCSASGYCWNWMTNYRLTDVIPLLFFVPRLMLPPPPGEEPVSGLLPAAAAAAALDGSICRGGGAELWFIIKSWF
jgi:hypothetical protein